MTSNGSAAYDLSLFDDRHPSITTIEPNKKSRYAKRKRSKAQTIINVIFKSVVGIIVVGFILCFIFFRVKLTEMNSVISEKKETLSILQSENVRLNSELSNLASADKIEDYAKKQGLQEVEYNQIEYFTVEGGDRIEKPSNSEGFLESLGIHIGKGS